MNFLQVLLPPFKIVISEFWVIWIDHLLKFMILESAINPFHFCGTDKNTPAMELPFLKLSNVPISITKLFFPKSFQLW